MYEILEPSELHYSQNPSMVSVKFSNSNLPITKHRHLEMTRRQPIAIRSLFRFCKLTTQQRGFEKRAYTVNPIPQLNFWPNPIPRLFYAQKVQSHSHFWFVFSSLSDPNPIFPVGKKISKFHFPFHLFRSLGAQNVRDSKEK